MATQGLQQASGQDWLAIWREMYDAERAQAERVTDPAFARGSDHWAPHARRFDTSGRRRSQPDDFMRFLLPQLLASDTLVDIGAGTGRYVPTLAGAVARVLAIEPSAAMRERLEGRVAEERLTNVEVIGAGWPLETPPACDVAIAAHVLYGVREIGPFLQQLHTATRRAWFLLLAVRHPSSYISPFWQRQYGEPRLPLPGALECLNALFQLGIPANLSLIPSNSGFVFDDAQEALEDIRLRLRLAPGPQNDAALRTMINELLDRDAEGRLRPRSQPAHAAVLWWKHDG
ncbi:MAG: hypothetical protein OHK0022_53820 [Roseiflexaceae bacterium]